MENRLQEKYKYHCRKAAEHFDAAAQALKESNGSPLAMVRARTQAALAEEHKAQARFYEKYMQWEVNKERADGGSNGDYGASGRT